MGQALLGLGRAMRGLNMYEGGLKLLVKALEVNRRLHGSNPHADIKCCMVEMCEMKVAMGRISEALKIGQEALDICTASPSCDVDGPVVARLLLMIAVCRQTKYDYEGATSCVNEGLEICGGFDVDDPCSHYLKTSFESHKVTDRSGLGPVRGGRPVRD